MTNAANNPAKKKEVRLAGMLPPSHILWNADCQSKKRVFEQVSLLLENIGGLSRDDLFSRLISRERLGSTAIGNGGAIPHVRIADLHDPLCALVRLKEPIQYNAQHDKNSSVHTLFFLIAPEKANALHLALLAVFSEMLLDEDFMRKLATCVDSQGAYSCIADWEAAHTESLNEIFSADE